MIKIIAIGKKTDYDSQINQYIKRLHDNFKIEWVLLNFSSENNETARNIESNEIMKKIKENDYVILLDERGKQINNDNLLQKINLNKNIVFIIGGPYGVNEQLRQRANFIWCLSDIIIPYEICRLILVEQIYRSQMINENHPYHHK